MSLQETLRLGRKAFLRGDWKRAKGLFLEVLEGPGSEREKDVAKRYLQEIYLRESRALQSNRRTGEKALPRPSGKGPDSEA